MKSSPYRYPGTRYFQLSNLNFPQLFKLRGDDAVPLSPFSLAITAQIDAEKAKGADMDFAMMGQLKKVDLPD